MTNEEKAYEIANKDRHTEMLMSRHRPSYSDGLLQGAIEMAGWKDKQFAEKAKRVIDACNNHCTPDFVQAMEKILFK